MIVADTSALLAILFDEPERANFGRVMSAQDQILISAVNLHEAIIVVRIRQGQSGVDKLSALLETHDLKIAAFDEAQVHGAAAAFARFGKGLHPRARLNLCDCAAYALAKSRGVPLLFKSDDFSHTDIAAAV